ncbi:hypothetical protein MXB_5426 [Myxobolus squamalis]|nr:hypothetical protein MXB_5426 [Myxobolus squamalis]
MIVNKRDPVNKNRNRSNKLVCADPNKEGQYCKNDNSKCVSRPCETKQSCIGTIADFVCKCSLGNFGKICKTNITLPNLHNFKCKNQYNCVKQCNQGWTGEKCRKRACVKNTCKNKGGKFKLNV